MLKKILIVVGCLGVAFVAINVGLAYQHKRDFDAVMAKYSHDNVPRR